MSKWSSNDEMQKLHESFRSNMKNWNRKQKIEEGVVGDVWDKFKGTEFARAFGAMDKQGQAYVEDIRQKMTELETMGANVSPDTIQDILKLRSEINYMLDVAEDRYAQGIGSDWLDELFDTYSLIWKGIATSPEAEAAFDAMDAAADIHGDDEAAATPGLTARRAGRAKAKAHPSGYLANRDKQR